MFTADFRSDTVSRPTDPMRAAMAAAAVGDDVFGDDPTVNALEAAVAALLGKPAGLYLPSGTQSNLCALMAHCERGDEYLVGDHAHTYRYEGGGAAVLGSIQPQPVRMLADGMVDLDHVAEVVKAIDHHFARSRLLCLENTHDGRVQGVALMHEARAAADAHGLALHLDGARLWNAAVDLGVTPATIAGPFDTVSVCLSKGLGAPVGSVLVGTDELIAKARRWRKVLGGGMRQAGIIAAAGLYAIEHNIARLAIDHANAARLAVGLRAVPGVQVTGQGTNMVFIDFDGGPAAAERARVELDAAGIAIRTAGSSARLVTHLDIDADAVDRLVGLLAERAA